MVEKDARKKIGLSRWDDFMKFMTNKTITINNDREIDFNTSDVNYFLGVDEVKTINQQFDEAKENIRKAIDEICNRHSFEFHIKSFRKNEPLSEQRIRVLDNFIKSKGYVRDMVNKVVVFKKGFVCI